MNLTKLPPQVAIPDHLSAAQLLSSIPHVDQVAIARELLRTHPEEEALLKRGGIHPFERTEIWNPYLKSKERGDFSNIGLHSAAVADLARRICDRLIRKDAISQNEAKQCVRRALLHDLGKRFEIFRRHVRGTDTPFDGHEIVDEYRQGGLDRELCDLLQDFGSETGGEKITQFLAISPAGVVAVAGALSRKIVRLCDNMTASTLPTTAASARTIHVTLIERAVVSDFRTRYPIFFRCGVGLTAKNDFCWVADLGRAAAQKELRLVGDLLSLENFFSDAVSSEILSLLAQPDADRPQQALLNLVLERS